MTTPSPAHADCRRTVWLCLGLAAATLAVYWQTAGFGFTNYDEAEYIVRNQRVQAGVTWANFVWAFTTGTFSNWHPLTWLSHMLDCQWFGLNPRGHHLVNVAFHVVNTLLLFLVLRRMTGAVWRCAFVAALFALHPLHVESVAWVAERKDVLSGFFWLLTMGAYARYAEQPGVRRYLPVLAFFALGLMAKPMLVTLPFVLLLLDVWPLRRVRLFAAVGQASSLPVPAASLPPGTRGTDAPLTGRLEACPTAASVTASIGKLILEKLPLFALAAASSVVTFLVQQKGGAMDWAEKMPLALRAGNAVTAYAVYLRKMIWPWDLAAIYPHPGAWESGPVAVAAVVLLALTALAVAGARRCPALLVGWLWYLGTLVPVIGLVQVGSQAMADRYTYIPLIGVFLAAAWGVAEFFANTPARRTVAAVVAAVALLACGVVAWRQAGFWRDSVALFSRAVAVTRNNAIAHYNLAQTLHQDLKQTEEALPHYRAAVRFSPRYPEAHINLGIVLYERGDLVEATNHLAQAVRLTPRDAEAHYNLARALGGLGRTGEAVAHGREALRLAPDYTNALNNLAWLLATTSQAEFRNGTEAVALATRACELTAYKQAIFIGTLAAALAEAGRFDEAVRAAQRAHDAALAAGEKELAAVNLKLQELYRAGKPFREPAAGP